MRRIFGLLLAASVLAATVSTAHAASPGSNGQVAFSVNANSDLLPGKLQRFYDLGMAVPGGPITRLTSTNLRIDETDASWSPSGDRLAFTRSRAGRPSQVYVLQADGTGLTRVSRGTLGGSDPTWSPDGRRMAFVRQGDIWVMDADGSHAHALTRTAAVEADPAWSPLGGKIAFTDATGFPNQVFTIDESGGNRVGITPAGTDDTAPDWSPDGTRLALARETLVEWSMGDGHGITTVRPDGSDPQIVLPPDYHVGSDQPAWSPDGEWLAFSAGGFGVCFIDTVAVGPDGSFGGHFAEVAGDVFGSGIYCNQDPSWQPILRS
jgi:TolB protein